MSTPDEEASISIPSIAFVAVLGFLIYRYFFAAPSSTNPTSGSSSARAGANGPPPRFTHAQVDQVLAMFPQLNRRDVMWDLHRNRGSVQGTIDRVLIGGRLETAPPSFQPILPASASPSTSASTTGAPLAASLAKANVEPDLITRYNLQNKVNETEKGKGKEEPNHGWASSKLDREAMLKRRRDEMILQARRKMQERDAGKTAGIGAVL